LSGHAITLRSAGNLQQIHLTVVTSARPGRGFVALAVGDLNRLQATLEVAGFDRSDKGIDDPGNGFTLAQVMTPSASAALTAFIAGAISAGLSIDGTANLTARSRHGGKMRSRQSRIAVGIAGECQLDSLAGQGLGLAFEQCGGGDRRTVAATRPATPRVARPAGFERPPARGSSGDFGKNSSCIVYPACVDGLPRRGAVAVREHIMLVCQFCDP
jgi:hypothetical protein